MTTLSQFTGGNVPPITIVNKFSSTAAPQNVTNVAVSAKTYQSGALTANTLATATGLGQVTGSGKIKLLCLYTNDATARTLRLKVTIDGTSVFDSTSSSVSSSIYGVFAVGFADASGTVFHEDGIYFNSSFKIEIASSLSETDKIAVGLVYDQYS